MFRAAPMSPSRRRLPHWALLGRQVRGESLPWVRRRRRCPIGRRRSSPRRALQPARLRLPMAQACDLGFANCVQATRVNSLTIAAGGLRAKGLLSFKTGCSWSDRTAELKPSSGNKVQQRFFSSSSFKLNSSFTTRGAFY